MPVERPPRPVRGGGRPAAPRRTAGIFFLLLCLPLRLAAAIVQTAPDPVAAPALAGPLLEGGTFRLEGLRGRPALVHFWASFCAPCLEELPSLQRLARRCPGLAVVTVAVDRGDPAPVRRMVERLGLELPVVLAPDPRIRERWEVRVLPVTYLLDREHRLRARVMGARRWDGDRAWIAQVLGLEGGGWCEGGGG